MKLQKEHINRQLYLLFFIICFTDCATGSKNFKSQETQSQLLSNYAEKANKNKDSLSWNNVEYFSKPELKFEYLRLYLSAKVNGLVILINSNDASSFFFVDLKLTNDNIKQIRDFAFLKPIFDSSTKRDFWEYREACEIIAERVINDIGWYNQCQIFLRYMPKNGYYMALASKKESVITLSEFKFVTNEEKEEMYNRYIGR